MCTPRASTISGSSNESFSGAKPLPLSTKHDYPLLGVAIRLSIGVRGFDDEPSRRLPPGSDGHVLGSPAEPLDQWTYDWRPCSRCRLRMVEAAFEAIDEAGGGRGVGPAGWRGDPSWTGGRGRCGL